MTQNGKIYLTTFETALDILNRFTLHRFIQSQNKKRSYTETRAVEKNRGLQAPDDGRACLAD